MVDVRTKPLTRGQISQFIGSERGIRSYEDMQYDLNTQSDALTNASFLVLNSEPTLGSERVLTIGAGLHGTDSGPNAPYTLINTAPDLVVSLTGGGTTVIGGAYPNFTITSSDQFTGTVTSVEMTAPTGFSVSGSPVTTDGTLALSYAAGYQGFTTAESNKLAAITLAGDLATVGAFDLTLTLTGATNVTLPTTGTLATLAGAESLSNKTLASPTITGTTIYSDAPGSTFTADTSGAAVSLAAAATVDFPNFSGSILINDHNSGGVGLWLVGSNSVLALGSTASVGGTVAYNSGISGYTFTNTSGGTRDFAFASTKTRNFS